MTDHRNDDELLSAYLAGELDGAEVEAFEGRLAGDPDLAARLDALADALVVLTGTDDVEEPAGFAQRLERRLARERGAADDAPVDLSQRRARRAGSARWWTGVGTAAAVVVVGAVMAAGLLGDLRGGDVASDSAGGPAMDADLAEEGGATTEAEGEVPAPGPVIVDEQVAVADAEALRRRFSDLPEVDRLLGTPVDEAAPLVEQFSATVRSGGPAPAADGDDSDGGAESAGAPAPLDCLSTVTADATAPLVPARVETVRYEGDAAIVYVLVTASDESQRLDRTELWVVKASDCATITFQQL